VIANACKRKGCRSWRLMSRKSGLLSSNGHTAGYSATVRGDKGPRNCGVDLRLLNLSTVVACPSSSNTVFRLSLLLHSLPPEVPLSWIAPDARSCQTTRYPTLPSHRLLTSAHHAEPFEHAVLCRPPPATALHDTMVRQPPRTLQAQQVQPSLTLRTGKSGTTPSTSAMNPRRRKTSSDASTFLPRLAEVSRPSSWNYTPSFSFPLRSSTWFCAASTQWRMT
jgi:hypothetical protein